MYNFQIFNLTTSKQETLKAYNRHDALVKYYGDAYDVTGMRHNVMGTTSKPFVQIWRIDGHIDDTYNELIILITTNTDEDEPEVSTKPDTGQFIRDLAKYHNLPYAAIKITIDWEV